MQKHKCDAKLNRGCASQQIILNGNYSYSMIEPYPCNSKQELHTRERYWIENFDCVNKTVPGRTDKERYQVYKEEIIKEQLEYYNKYKEEINKKRATKIVCECGSKISKSSMPGHRKSAKHIKLMTLICPPCPQSEPVSSV